MSIDQITRGHVIANCLEGRCTVQQAALRLNLSRRRVQQLKRRSRKGCSRNDCMATVSVPLQRDLERN
ncbi:hypothetical protein TPHV1_280001 [Treponema phagedenis]|uniref:Helix-turn-helix domain-containing protein n=2 Tax=Treponema phagedenis TaxID=162 RepID=A0A0B7GTW5_TREPH|nr:hypothetical protein TPHV1_280001 [Treponema phagedenis]